MFSRPDKPSVIIYADPLLPPSATFIRAQGESLWDFTPYYVGARAYPKGGLELPEDRTLLINDAGSALGRIKEIPFKVFGFAPSFFRKARRCNPLLVHAHTGPGGVSALPLARFLQVPLITTFHGSDVATSDRGLRKHPHFTARAYRRRKRELQGEGKLFIAVSKFVRDKLIAQGFPPGRTLLHYIGVDTGFFKPERAASREPIVLFVGTLHEVKGCAFAIRAMEKVQAELPGVEFVILGNGPLRSSLAQMSREKLRRYRFLGTQPPEVVRQWMNRAKILLVPSVTAESGATEAFGLVLAEAQAMCLPVVSSLSGGIPEAVAHGETGMLAPERDWTALAEFILFLLKNENDRSRMGIAGRERVKRYFDLKKQTRILEESYRVVLAEKSLHITSFERAAESQLF